MKSRFDAIDSRLNNIENMCSQVIQQTSHQTSTSSSPTTAPSTFHSDIPLYPIP